MRRSFHLSVGINDYPGTGADLSGCVNDAMDWHALLSDAPAKQVIGAVLLNHEATRANVVNALLEMVDEARFGDRIVFTYSGHGSRIPDRNGDEADGWDECLVLYDYRVGGLLTDDDLHFIFSKRRWGVKVVVISDSCNSGTMQRLLGFSTGLRPRFLPPTAILDGVMLERAIALEAAEVRGTSKPRPITALLAGCAEDEVSYDAWFGNRPRGAFTAAALETYSPTQTLSAWHKKILGAIKYPQTPQLVATSSQRRWKL